MPYAEHEELKNRSRKIDECLKQHNWFAPPQYDTVSFSDFFKELYITTQPYVLSHIIFNNNNDDIFEKDIISRLLKDKQLLKDNK